MAQASLYNIKLVALRCKVMRMREKYGVDAPGVVLTFGSLGLLVSAAIWPAILTARTLAGATAGTVVGLVLACYAGVCWITTGWVVAGSLWGKPREWERLLDAAGLRGDERVIEVGPGRGPVLVAAAKRLTTGRAVGVDIWRAKDQTGNTRQALLDNLAAADVADRVEVITGDMRALPFPDGSFDLALASLAIHNLPANDQRRAIAEILRVLTPGGRVIILDFRRTSHFADVLRESGARQVRRSRPRWITYPPVRVVTATRRQETFSSGNSAEPVTLENQPTSPMT
jgi:arsenite methyltransferase